jgi:hypothetical protein
MHLSNTGDDLIKMIKIKIKQINKGKIIKY